MKKQNGQSLIEVIVALGMAALVIFGIVKATTVSIKNANYSQDQTQAVSLAQKKITEIIAEKNSNPVNFFANLSSHNSSETVNQFCVKTALTAPAAEIANILVIVYWGEKGTGTKCNNLDYLHNYQVQTDVTK